MTAVDQVQWWLASLGRNIVWARLRVLEAGTAEVFDSDGNTLAYDSEDTARAALMDAEFVACVAGHAAPTRSATSHNAPAISTPPMIVISEMRAGVARPLRFASPVDR